MTERLPGPPTRNALSIQYGFPVPEAFVTLVRVAFEGCRDIDEPLEAFYDDICSLYLGPDCGYQQTPPELFPFGSMGVDGVHYGYVIHAPELPAEDYPVGELCPMDSDGVIEVGADTLTAIENLISSSLQYWFEWEPSLRPAPEKLMRCQRRIASISAALEINPDRSMALRRYGPNGQGIAVTPNVPDGWMHLATANGIGVLAPRAAFLPGGTPQLALDSDPEAFIALGRAAMDSGFPASALAHYRDGYWQNWTNEAVKGCFTRGMADCYLALGRPLLADVVAAK